jgi:hypothetical protein
MKTAAMMVTEAALAQLVFPHALMMEMPLLPSKTAPLVLACRYFLSDFELELRGPQQGDQRSFLHG